MHIYGIQVGDGNGKPLQYSCLENPVDRGASWAAVHRVAQSRTQLKRLSKHAHIGEGNGNPLQCSCLRNPRNRGAWWAAVYRVAGSDTTKAAQQQHGTQKDGTDESIYRTEMVMQTQRTDLWAQWAKERVACNHTLPYEKQIASGNLLLTQSENWSSVTTYMGGMRWDVGNSFRIYVYLWLTHFDV